MIAYYNEKEKKAAAWIRELINAGEIAPGVVDERSIEDVHPNDLKGFTQCHFFAGVGVWSLALRRAGWPDSRPVWTGSCPCQPFSQAGEGNGFADERHLWPAWFHLITQCRPGEVLGEQVASRDGLDWFDLVHADLEDAGYACGPTDLCAAGVGAPHIRSRLWFVAVGLGNTSSSGGGRDAGAVPGAEGSAGRGVRGVVDLAQSAGVVSGLADATGGRSGPGLCDLGSSELGRPLSPDDRTTRLLGDAERTGREGGLDDHVPGTGRGSERRFLIEPSGLPMRFRADDGRGTPWSVADWILCRDGKYRPVEPGSFPLAHGAPARMGRLRGYGNAICAEAATTFIKATGLI